MTSAEQTIVSELEAAEPSRAELVAADAFLSRCASTTTALMALVATLRDAEEHGQADALLGCIDAVIAAEAATL